MQRDGGVVDDLHAFDGTDVGGHFAGTGRGIQDALDVVPNGLGVEGGAVLEDNVAAQGERPLVRHLVGRPAGCQRRVEPAVGADDEQGIGDHVVDEPGRLVRFDVAVQRGGLARGGPGDDEFVGGRAGTVAPGAGGEEEQGCGGERAGAAGDCHRCGAPLRSAFVPSFSA